MIETQNFETPPNPIDRARIDELALFLSHWRGSLMAVSIVTIAVLFAGSNYVSFDTRIIWCTILTCSYGAQAFLCLNLERKPSLSRAFPYYMPWLLASVTGTSSIWAAVPWLVSPPSNTVMVAVSLFNITLIYCLANAPSSRNMLICAITPYIVLNTSALAFRSELTYASAYAAFSCMILFYGLRVQKAINSTMMERHVARQLAEELKKHQQQLVKVERENALLQERQRLMSDMHDGLGATLLSALAAIERHQPPQPAVVEALRGCVEDLRLVIDSLEPMEHNLVTLLATIRYRLGQRLNAAGLTLEWDIQDLPELPWLEAPDALHVLRLVQEALVNVLKHAHASSVRVATRDLGHQVEIHLQDNGCGFDYASITPGRGLRSQARRVERLGGELEINSSVGNGTSVILRLPVQRR